MSRIRQRTHTRRRQANTILVIFNFLRQSNYHFAVSPISREELKTEKLLDGSALSFYCGSSVFVNLRELQLVAAISLFL
jgi:hypothetical protein